MMKRNDESFKKEHNKQISKVDNVTNSMEMTLNEEKRQMLEEFQMKEQKYGIEKSENTGLSSGGQVSKSMIRIRINKDRKVMSHLE